MAMLIRAVIGFTLAFALLYPKAFAHRFDTPRLQSLKSELAGQHPGERLLALVSGPMRAERPDDSRAAD